MNMKANNMLLKFAALLILSSTCNGYNTLIAIPTAIRSLHRMFVTLGQGLTARGHNVTVISPFEIDYKLTGIHSYQLQTMPSQFEKSMFDLSKSKYLIFEHMYSLISNTTEILWSDPKMMALWKMRKEFDLVITMSYLGEMGFPFLMNSSATFVQVCTPGVEYHAMSREGNWLMPSTVPNILLSFDDNMNFLERTMNLPAMIFFYNLESNLLRKFQNNYLNKYFPELEDLLSYYDRVALTLINGHFALDGPVPLLPSQIEIGTINAKKAQPLENVDKKLAKFVEGSGDAGIIYFSLGSIAKGTDIPKNAKDMFLEAFRKIPQRVLWKYEGDDLDLPPNVLTQKWMPQQDILGHPKTRVFISHCGNLGTQEAKYHGVPVLGVPIAFDQPRNAARMERKGYALVINWENLSVDNIVEKLNILINDKSYKERLTTVSRILQDQKDSPLERAIWWLEYVVRHKGAPHLNYAGRRLSLFQYIMLDVLLFWFAVLAAIVLVIVFTVRALCCRKSSMKENGQQKKKRQ